MAAWKVAGQGCQIDKRRKTQKESKHFALDESSHDPCEDVRGEVDSFCH